MRLDWRPGLKGLEQLAQQTGGPRFMGLGSRAKAQDDAADIVSAAMAISQPHQLLDHRLQRGRFGATVLDGRVVQLVGQPVAAQQQQFVRRQPGAQEADIRHLPHLPQALQNDVATGCSRASSVLIRPASIMAWTQLWS